MIYNELQERTIAIPDALKKKILDIHEGRREPRKADEVKSFHIAHGLRKGDVVATEYGTLHVTMHIREKKFKGRYIKGSEGEAYFIIGDMYVGSGEQSAYLRIGYFVIGGRRLKKVKENSLFNIPYLNAPFFTKLKKGYIFIFFGCWQQKKHFNA